MSKTPLIAASATTTSLPTSGGGVVILGAATPILVPVLVAAPLNIAVIDFNGHVGVSLILNKPTYIGEIRDSASGLVFPLNQTINNSMISLVEDSGNIHIAGASGSEENVSE